MVYVKVRPDEPFESAVRRFTAKCIKAGIPQDAARKMYYEKPSRKRYAHKSKHKKMEK